MYCRVQVCIVDYWSVLRSTSLYYWVLVLQSEIFLLQSAWFCCTADHPVLGWACWRSATLQTRISLQTTLRIPGCLQHLSSYYRVPACMTVYEFAAQSTSLYHGILACVCALQITSLYSKIRVSHHSSFIRFYCSCISLQVPSIFLQCSFMFFLSGLIIRQEMKKRNLQQVLNLHFKWFWGKCQVWFS